MNPDTRQLAESISNADHALGLCLSNRFNKAKDFLAPLDGDLMYHALSKGTICYLQAVLTYEHDLITAAYDRVKEATVLCDKNRKKFSWGETLHSLVSRPSYSEFTEGELHAELCYAECLLEWALLTFIQDENLISFIKGGLKIKHAYSIYRNCMMALQEQQEQATSLKISNNRADFESGVYMGVGTFNLLLSLLPTRVLRLLEWVGFSGDKLQGLSWLDKGYTLDGLRSPMCTISLLGYHIVASPLLGIGDTDIRYVNSILDQYLGKFPESSIFLFFSGRLKQTQGLINEALLEYEKSVSGNIDWQQIHHICYWEMMWCYSFQADWEKAAEYAEKLSSESKWSKASYNYIQAAFLIMRLFEMKNFPDKRGTQKDEDSLNEKISHLMLNVAIHKQRIAGKSLPFEKFACCRVEKFHATGTLVLPALEVIHLWNGFPSFYKHTKVIQHFLKLVDLALEDMQKANCKLKHTHDSLSLCYLLKGICLRYLKKTEQAEECFRRVASSTSSQHSSKMDYYLPPFAAAEIGFMYRDLNDNEKALNQLQYTLKHYSKYGLESRLHFRIHSGIEVLKSRLANRDKKTEQVSEDFEDISIHSDDSEQNINMPADSCKSVPLSNGQEVGYCGETITMHGSAQMLHAKQKKNSLETMGEKNNVTLASNDVMASSTDGTPFHTPSSSPILSEASSSISPQHRYKCLASPSPRLSKETAI